MKSDYNVIAHKNGYIVQLNVDKARFYCDNDGLWLRSKSNMSPMKKGEAQNLAESCKKDDIRIEREWRI